MTFAIGNVQGGTHAGWKRQKPAPKPWLCACPEHEHTRKLRAQPAYLSRCTDCKTERPGYGEVSHTEV